MKGYLSFILVIASIFLFISLLLVFRSSSSVDLSKAIAVERAYGLGMNVKEAAFESVTEGAKDGFRTYDALHDVSLCKHCPDHFCVPPTPANPAPPNICDAMRCSGCFREAEARESAATRAITKIRLLKSHHFDPDFTISLDEPEVEVFLLVDQLSKNGFSLDYVRFKEPMYIHVDSSKFDVKSVTRIPKGWVVSCG